MYLRKYRHLPEGTQKVFEEVQTSPAGIQKELTGRSGKHSWSVSFCASTTEG